MEFPVNLYTCAYHCALPWWATDSTSRTFPNSCSLTVDDVEVTGIVRAQWRPLFPGARCDGTLSLHACHMRTVNSLHRAVAPPAEGLAEQFRCAWYRSHARGCPLQTCTAQLQLQAARTACQIVVLEVC
jgi:hypothetical protein